MNLSRMLLGACVGLSGCTPDPPRDCSTATAEAMACIERNAAHSEHDQLSACLPFSAPVRMKGLWVIGLERSSFFENETRYDSSLNGGDDVWLYVEDAVRKKFDASNAVFTVEIIGRRAMCEGQWGHMGMSRGAVIADRMVSIRR